MQTVEAPLIGGDDETQSPGVPEESAPTESAKPTPTKPKPEALQAASAARSRRRSDLAMANIDGEQIPTRVWDDKTFTSDLECAFAALLPNKGSSPKISTTTALEAGATSPQSPASSNSVTGGPRERRSSLGLIHVFPLRGHGRRNNAALLLHVLYSSVEQEGPTTAARIRARV